MSHVNRNDRLSRRLLGFTGKVQAVELQNRLLADRVAALETDREGLLLSIEQAVTAIREMDARLAAIEQPAQPEPEAPWPTTTDAPAPVTT